MVGVRGRVCVGDWEGDGGGGGFTDMKVFALLSFLCLYVHIFSFLTKRVDFLLGIRTQNHKTFRKNLITNSKFNLKTTTF